eukprot:jgi/Tetstr1/447200/TSEL_034637.t1
MEEYVPIVNTALTTPTVKAVTLQRSGTGVLQRFVQFLDSSNIVSSAAAFILGIAANNFFRTFTDETVINVINTYYDLSDNKLKFGKVEIHYGLILVQLINLAGVAFTIFVVVSAAQRFLGWT